jgi:hypothetical protein
MLTIKCFISAGCSFSQVPNADVSWPVHLRDCFHPECNYYLGQGAAGNGIISRKVIYALQKALEIYAANEILVGIMWSGHDRMETYANQLNLEHQNINCADNYCNPVRVSQDYSYYIMNHHWNDELTKTYYKNFYSDIGSYILTIEHILRTQWVLQNAGVPYFMTEYSYDCLPRNPEIRHHNDVGYLYDMIDKSKWLPIDNMWQFAVDTGLPFARPNDNHPSSEHHELFVRDVLLPWLYQKYLFKYHRPN